MSKKDLASVTADLSVLASQMPTQRLAAQVPAAPAPPALKVVPTPKAVGAEEAVTQFSLSLRKSLRKQLASLAADTDMTMRAFVLNALKEKGLDVHAADLADLRKERA
jgi:hypothetical protein